MYYEVSAKTNEGINKLFEDIGKNILLNRTKNTTNFIKTDKNRKISRINISLD